MVHLESLQRIADENGGNRGTGEPGYQASVDQVVTVLENAGYQPELWAFEVPFEADSSALEVLGAEGTPTGEITGAGFVGARGGEATGTLVGVDLTARGASSSGCETGDFAELPARSVALMQRGGCDFATKARNAQDAGAVAAVVLIDDWTESWPLVMRGDGDGLTIPVVSVTGPATRTLPDIVGAEVRVVSGRESGLPDACIHH